MEDTGHARIRVGAQGRVVLPAELRAALGFVEGATLVAYIEGEGRLVIESPEAIRRALLKEWSGAAGEVSLVDELRADRRAAAAREAEQVEADRTAHNRTAHDRTAHDRRRRPAAGPGPSEEPRPPADGRVARGRRPAG